MKEQDSEQIPFHACVTKTCILELTFVLIDGDDYRWLLQVKTMMDITIKWTYILTHRRLISTQPTLNITLIQSEMTAFNLRWLHSNDLLSN